MLRTLVGILVLSAPILSQGIGVPFSMNGGPMQVAGTFSVSNGSVCCSGVIDVYGASGSFCCKPLYSNGGGISWQIIVNLDEATYGLWIHVDIQGKLTGYWYDTGFPAVRTPLYP